MSSDPGIWYRVGYALEQARGRAPSSDDASRLKRAKTKTKTKAKSAARDTGVLGWPGSDALVASAVAALAGRLLNTWRPAANVTFTRLLRVGVAGAGAALLLDVAKALLVGRGQRPLLEPDAGTRLLVGAGQGLLYGTVVEPRVPGPPVLKGALFAFAEYLADSAGGLTQVLGAHAPHSRLPVVSDLFQDLEPHDREVLEHLAFGIMLAILSGPAPSGNGSGGPGHGD